MKKTINIKKALIFISSGLDEKLAFLKKNLRNNSKTF